ncbi:hypothetical protein BH09MYX1_BH09MYX1_49350 [soil metagenome]
MAQELDVHADDVQVDARKNELDLHGNVRADLPPFHLSADALHLRRSSLGVVVDGDGRLAFCPCLGTPLGVAFSQATVAPPADLFLKNARLEIFGLPIFWLPYFWLRGPTRFGVLPPDLQYRARDGVYLGGGLHVPWKDGGGEGSLDLRAGGYFLGGAVVDAELRTKTTTARLRWDHLSGDGLRLDARGTAGGGSAAIAWDVDALRGVRAVQSTTPLEAASRPYDVAAIEAQHFGTINVALGYRAVSTRGSDPLVIEASGPLATASMGGALGPMTADGIVDAGLLRLPGAQTLSFARADLGVEIAGHAGPVSIRDRVRAAGLALAGGTGEGIGGDATTRVTLGIPLVRGFASGVPGDSLRHRIEPFVAGFGAIANGDRALGVLPGRGAALLADGVTVGGEGGSATSLGRWGSGSAGEAGASAGAVTDARGARAVVRWHAAATSSVVGGSVLGAHAIGGSASGDAIGFRVRLGAMDRWGLRAYGTWRRGDDPIAARVIDDAPVTVPLGYVATEGFSGGAAASIPWAKFLSTRGGVDWDFESGTLLGAWGTVELRDTCGCLRLRVTGAHRLGREGLDVWMSIDFAPR